MACGRKHVTHSMASTYSHMTVGRMLGLASTFASRYDTSKVMARNVVLILGDVLADYPRLLALVAALLVAWWGKKMYAKGGTQ